MQQGSEEKNEGFEEVAPALRESRIGVALSGGGVRGLSHIGVIKAITDFGIKPVCVTGTSVGSIVGVAYSSGMKWDEIADMAKKIWWPSLLTTRGIEDHCKKYFPPKFSDLKIPFAALATDVRTKRSVRLTSGDISSAVSASCAMRTFRRPVMRGGLRLVDGGISCALPSIACRELGAKFIIGSDVSGRSALLRFLRVKPDSLFGFFYARNYSVALDATDILVQPRIPFTSHIPGSPGVDAMIRAGETSSTGALYSLPADS